MPLIQKITEDMKAAMKSGEKTRLEVIRFAIAGLQAAQKEKESKEPGATLSDEEVISILQKDAKRRKESIELFKQGGRNDLVEQEATQLAMLSEYLPKELSHEEIAMMVDAAMAAGSNDFSLLMKETMKAVKGRADGKQVGAVIKEKLGTV
jgi:uncharacterized protein YqeY